MFKISIFVYFSQKAISLFNCFLQIYLHFIHISGSINLNVFVLFYIYLNIVGDFVNFFGFAVFFVAFAPLILYNCIIIMRDFAAYGLALYLIVFVIICRFCFSIIL